MAFIRKFMVGHDTGIIFYSFFALFKEDAVLDVGFLLTENSLAIALE
jgi:hypothetical protein